MIPVKLSLSGFLSYRQPVEIDFTGFDLACISGSNGAGKSSILDAITWALFGQARKRDDALINKHSETAEVAFTFIYEGNTYKVQRAKSEGKATILEFHILSGSGKWKPLTERSLRATENLIERAVDTLVKDRTAIVIAHRLGTVGRTDEIMILEDGRIIEHGGRGQLVRDPSSHFYRLLQTGLEEMLV